MKASIEGKFVFEVGRFVLVNASKGYSHEIPGEKAIIDLPDLGVTIDDRKVVFDKATGICIEDCESYYLIRAISSAMPAIQAAVMEDPLTMDLVIQIAEIMNSIPTDGAIASVMNRLSVASMFLGGLDYMGAAAELWDIYKKKYPEKIEAYLATLSVEERKYLDSLLAKMPSKNDPDDSLDDSEIEHEGK